MTGGTGYHTAPSVGPPQEKGSDRFARNFSGLVFHEQRLEYLFLKHHRERPRLLKPFRYSTAWPLRLIVIARLNT